MTNQKRIKVEIGIPSQIEPGQEVEVESVPGITAARIVAGPEGGTVEVGADGSIAVRGMRICGAPGTTQEMFRVRQVSPMPSERKLP